MRTTRLVLLAAAWVAAGAGLAAAQPASPPPAAPGATPESPPAGPAPGRQRDRAGREGREARTAARGEQIFADMDTNNDGRVTREEYWIWVQTRFNEADGPDRDGAVTPDEARAYFESRRAVWRGSGQAPAPGGRGPRAEMMQEHFAAFFRMLDANLDGKVSLEELRPFTDARFRAMDANSDGAVTQEEMRQMMPQGHGPRRGGPGRPGAPGAPSGQGGGDTPPR